MKKKFIKFFTSGYSVLKFTMCIITTMQIVPVHTRMDMITTMPAMGRMHMKTTDTIIMKAVAAGMTMLMKHMRIVKFREHSSCM